MSEEKLQVFELFFNPKSIAIIGTSKNPKSLAALFLRGLLSAGFKGELYPVGNSGGMIEGITIHPDLGLIPGDVDYAIACVPSSKLPDVLDECAAKGIKAVHVFTGGFSENCEEGRENEIEMVAKARALGIRIIGPNCVGICSPANNMSLQPFPPSLILKGEPGTVAFMAQSGRIAFEIIEHGMSRGIYFSKVVGFGNGCDLNSADFMEYFALDPATRVIGAYVEGTTDGSRLTRSVREASTNKPVVILKGGQTEAGARAASSHTGSLAISYTAWQVALRQAGAIVVETIEEMADTLMAFQNTTTLQGNRAAIITGIWAGGGGMSVAATDAMARHGLDVPFFTGETVDKFRASYPNVGTILHNPVDVTGTYTAAEIEYAMQLAANDPHIDFLVVDLCTTIVWHAFETYEFEKLTDILITFKNSHSKPIIAVTSHGISEAPRTKVIEQLSQAEISVYPTMERAARAIANVLRHQSIGGDEHGAKIG